MSRKHKKHKRKSSLAGWWIAGLIVLAVVFISWWGATRSAKADPSSSTVNVGNIAPDFNLPSTTGGNIKLSDYLDKQNVLIYFHEGLTCDPCIQQMPELEKYRQQFLDMNVVPLYVALDPVDQMKSAVAKYDLQTPVLSYQNANMEVDYDLLPYSMGMDRRAGHTFVLIGTDGKIEWRKDYWPSRGMTVDGGKMFVDGSEILSQIKQTLGK